CPRAGSGNARSRRRWRTPLRGPCAGHRRGRRTCRRRRSVGAGHRDPLRPGTEGRRPSAPAICPGGHGHRSCHPSSGRRLPLSSPLFLGRFRSCPFRLAGGGADRKRFTHAVNGVVGLRPPRKARHASPHRPSGLLLFGQVAQNTRARTPWIRYPPCVREGQPMLNLSAVLEDGARTVPEKDCLVFGDLRLNYSVTDMITNQVANLLVSRGIRPGDRVALACPNLPYFPFVYYGALKAGAVVVPLNVLLTPSEIVYHLEDSDAKAFFAFTGSPELPLGERAFEAFNQVEGCTTYIDLPATPGATESTIEGAETLWKALEGQPGEFETVQANSDDTAVIIYTSGTTGKPKGAELSHNNLMMNAIVASRLVNKHPEGFEISLVALPLFHIFGQTLMLNAALYRHSTLVLMPRFDGDEALRLMEKEN